MPAPGTPLEKLGFLTIGLFDANDPRPGHETTLDVIALGEQLGFDSAFVRHRHLQYGISSPVAVLAAATQRTTRIQLGVGQADQKVRRHDEHLLVGGQPLAGVLGLLGQVVVDPDDAPVGFRLRDLASSRQLPPACFTAQRP